MVMSKAEDVMKRPIVFISSTVRDLEDMRSATRFLLEERGYEVLDSNSHEFPDSRVDHAFDACEGLIEKSHSFLLIVGSRTDGTHEDLGRIHDARLEYRKAYELQREGKLKIIALKRADSSNPKAQVNALENRPSTVASGPNLTNETMQVSESIKSFLDEVGRNDKTISAATGDGDSPSVNRIHEFRTFREVVDLLEVNLIGERSRDQVWLTTLLRTELFGILKQAMSCQGRTDAFQSRNAYEMFRADMKIDQIRRSPDPFRVEWKHWNAFGSYVLDMIPLRFATTSIVRVLESNLFLECDRKNERIVETSIYKAIERLKFEIDSFNTSNLPESFHTLFRYERDQSGGKNDVLVDYDRVILMMKAYAHLSNVINLCRALLHNLSGGDFVMPALLPFSPLLDKENLITEGFPTDDRVWDYVRSYK
jgi:hypothetical protein